MLRGFTEDTDDASVSLAKLESMFNSVGLTLYKNENTFKSTYQIFDELAQIWDDLSDTQQALMVERIAGKRQGNIVAAMLGNWEDARKAYETGLNSMGSAMKEFEKTQDSVQYKLNQFHNNLIGFWQTALDTESLKSLIDMGNSFINLLTAIVDKIGLLPPVIFTLSLAFATMNNSIRAAIVANTELGISLTGLTTSFSLLGKAIVSVGTFLSRVFFPIAIITVASFAVQKLTQHFVELREQQKKLEQQNENLIKAWSGNNKEIRNLIAEAERLREVTKDGQFGSLEDRQRYYELTNQINNVLPNLISNIDAEGNAHLKNKDKIQEEIKYLDELLEKRKELSVAQAEETFSELIDDSKTLELKINNLRRKIERGSEGYGNNLRTYSKAQIKQFELELKEYEKQFSESQDKIKDKVKETVNDILYLNNIELDDDISQQLSKIVEAIDFTDKSPKEIVDTTNKLADLFKTVSIIPDFTWTDKFESKLIDIGLTKDDIALVKEEIKKIGEESKKSASNVEELGFSLEDIKNTINKSQEKYKLAQQALDEYNETGKYNITTLLDLAEKHENLLNVLGDEEAVRLELMKIIEDEEETQKRAYASMLAESEAFYNARILGNTELVNELSEKYDVDFNNFKKLSEAKLAIESNLIKELSEMWSQYYNVSTKSFTIDFHEIQRAKGYIEQAGGTVSQELNDTIERVRKLGVLHSQLSKDMENIAYQAAGVSFSGINFGTGSSSSGGSSASSQSEEFSKVYDLTAIKAEKLKHEIELLNDALDDTNDIVKKQDISKQLIAKYEEYQNYLKQVFDYQNSQLEKLKNNLRSVLSETDFNKLMSGDLSSLEIANEETADLIDKFYDLQSAARSTEIEINSIDDAIRQVKESTIEMYEEIYEKRKDEYEDWKSKLEDVADDIIDIYKEIYEKQKELKLEAIEEELEAEEERYDKVIEQLEDELDKVEEIINAKLDLIDKTKDEYDYNKQLAKLQEERQDILNQINELSMDDSIEARNKVYELNEELAEKEEEIEELKYDRQVELRKESLNDLLDSYRKEIEEKKDAEEKKLEAVKNRLELEREYWEQHYDNLLNDERRFAEIREDIMNGHLDNILDDLDDFSDYVSDNMESIGEAISENLLYKLEEAKELLEDTYENYSKSKRDYEEAEEDYEEEKSKNKKSSSRSSSSSIKGKTFKGTVHTYYVDEYGGIYKDDRYLQLTAEQLKALSLDPMGKKALEYARWVKQHNTRHKGGFAGSDYAPNKISDLVNKLFNTKGNEQLVLALKDEFFTPQKNIIQNFIPNMKNFVSSISQPAQNTGGTIVIDRLIQIDKIENGANIDINKLTDQALNRFVERLKPYGFLPRRV